MSPANRRRMPPSLACIVPRLVRSLPARPTPRTSAAPAWSASTTPPARLRNAPPLAMPRKPLPAMVWSWLTTTAPVVAPLRNAFARSVSGSSSGANTTRSASPPRRSTPPPCSEIAPVAVSRAKPPPGARTSMTPAFSTRPLAGRVPSWTMPSVVLSTSRLSPASTRRLSTVTPRPRVTGETAGLPPSISTLKKSVPSLSGYVAAAGGALKVHGVPSQLPAPPCQVASITAAGRVNGAMSSGASAFRAAARADAARRMGRCCIGYPFYSWSQPAPRLEM